MTSFMERGIFEEEQDVKQPSNIGGDVTKVERM